MIIQPLLIERQRGPVQLSHAAQSWFEWGFLDEDDFDAMIGLLAMLDVVTGKRVDHIPEDNNIRKIEGWILGKAGEGRIARHTETNYSGKLAHLRSESRTSLDRIERMQQYNS